MCACVRACVRACVWCSVKIETRHSSVMKLPVWDSLPSFRSMAWIFSCTNFQTLYQLMALPQFHPSPLLLHSTTSRTSASIWVYAISIKRMLSAMTTRFVSSVRSFLHFCHHDLVTKASSPTIINTYRKKARLIRQQSHLRRWPWLFYWIFFVPEPANMVCARLYHTIPYVRKEWPSFLKHLLQWLFFFSGGGGGGGGAITST